MTFVGRRTGGRQGPHGRRHLLRALAAVALACPINALSGGSEALYPDILSVHVRAAGDDRFDFDVTVSSPYDTPRRYADGFRVTTDAGAVLGEHTLWHDHQDEQPFTRSLTGVRAPRGVQAVTVQGRDQVSSHGGRSVRIRLPGR